MLLQVGMWLATILNSIGVVLTLWNLKRRHKYINDLIHENVELHDKNYRLKIELIDARGERDLYKGKYGR